MIFCPKRLSCDKYWYAERNCNCAETCKEFNKKYVYLGGAIDRVPAEFSLGWRKEATKILRENGFMVLDPTEGKDLYDPDINTKKFSPEYIVNSDLEMIKKSDILLVEISRKDIPYHGTSMELVYAHQWNKQIFVWGDTSSYWVRYHATEIFENLYSAIGCILKGDDYNS
jgi:nucleoside 2-deoxyribosyltransferase